MWPFKKIHWDEVDRQFLLRSNSRTGIDYLVGNSPNYNIPPSPVTLITYVRRDNKSKHRQETLIGHIKQEK